jgi:hypothetical protein
MKKTILTLCLLSFALCVSAQKQTKIETDSVGVVRDTVLLESYAARYDPRKAIMYAAIVPGLGQIYNKKYWKLPLVYGGFIGFGYGVSFYQKGYTKYKAELFDILDTGAPISDSGYTEDQLRNIVDKYRRERDFMMILMAGMYLLQLVDAHVDAHLKEFDLNPNLHVRLQPVWETDMLTGRSVGLSLKFRF